MIGNIQDNNIFVSEHYIDPIDPKLLKAFLARNKIKDILKGNSNDIITNNNNKKIGKIHEIDNEAGNKEKSIYNSDEEMNNLFPFNNQLKNQINDNFNEVLEGKLNLKINQLENENVKLKDELSDYKKEIENLKKELNKSKEDNMKLSAELMNAKKIISNLNNFQQKNQENIKMISNLNELIQIKDKELNDLKIQLINIGNKNKLANYNDILVVHFISKDEKINFGIKCLKTDTFAEVEEKLYQKYEEYRETNNNFFVKGKIILRFKKICENNIKDGDKIQLITI